ncbi:MAG: FtsX-like permease family protein [Clostridia bacterium]|nr:FtsX-like permease family protein [Clostridia bacterium]
MLLRLLKNELRAAKLLSFATALFTGASTLLIVLASVLFTSLWGAVNGLMETAKTPDYLQMHAGELDPVPLEVFAAAHPEISAWQVAGFLNLENDALTLGGKSLAGNTQDNGLCVQGKGFDFLLGPENELPEPGPGEVYVPVCYRSVYDLNVGDGMTIGNAELRIAGFLRDAQMNSMMASSKRFLVCPEEYERFRPAGEEEFLIEYLLEPGTDTDVFAAGYLKAGLPAEGPAVTKPLIRLMNALSDGMMIFTIFLVGVAVLAVSLLCIGFITALGAERDRRENGMLKALGIPNRTVLGLRFAKYILLSAVGGIFGVFGALLLAKPLGASLRELYGRGNGTVAPVLVAVPACILVLLAVLCFVRRILKSTGKMTVVEALFSETAFRSKVSRGQTAAIGLVAAVCVMMALIPENLYATLASPDFVTYMGIGNAEIRMDVRRTENTAQVAERLAAALAADPSVASHTVLETVSCAGSAAGKEGIRLLIETGDHSVFPVAYTEGCAPQVTGEIALSVLQAADLGVHIGDTIALGEDGAESATVCGLYSDITNGGKTAKMRVAPGAAGNAAPLWSIVYVTLANGASKETFFAAYGGFGADIVDIPGYVTATYGPTLRLVSLAKSVALGAAVPVVFVVVLLFVRLGIEKKRGEISLMKALGFRSAVLRGRYMKRALLPVAAGLLAGGACALLFGEGICGLALGALGGSGFRFSVSVPATAFAVACISAAGALAVFLGSGEVKKIGASECMRGKE